MGDKNPKHPMKKKKQKVNTAPQDAESTENVSGKKKHVYN